jgi:hypothetical protein
VARPWGGSERREAWRAGAACLPTPRLAALLPTREPAPPGTMQRRSSHGPALGLFRVLLVPSVWPSAHRSHNVQASTAAAAESASTAGEAHVVDVMPMTWQKLNHAGDPPSKRSGHTFTEVNGSGFLFGGASHCSDRLHRSASLTD